MTELLTITYRSFSCLRKPIEGISAILSESLDRNQRLGITGLLLFDGAYFLQTIEGPSAETRSVYTKIVSDARHTDVTPLRIRLLRARVFPTWRMKLIGPAATARIVPDMDGLDFAYKRLDEIHLAAKQVARPEPEQSYLLH
ncbi:MULTISPECIES: BLUF domain-containing protein [unclassified Thioclava]|uniref:BLUF domain-containing protein n=1 Tax=unclassified Thioclava TaxID=2621713 RepID=UPI00143B409E|nr:MULTISPECIES: BLUF domain-containing protein [unclassified Thioclava]